MTKVRKYCKCKYFQFQEGGALSAGSMQPCPSSSHPSLPIQFPAAPNKMCLYKWGIAQSGQWADFQPDLLSNTYVLNCVILIFKKSNMKV